MKAIVFGWFACILLVVACTEETKVDQYLGPVPTLPANPYNYANPPLPGYLNAPPIAAQINTPATNVITDHGATLGRVLFLR